jgi:hypothetical protein
VIPQRTQSSSESSDYITQPLVWFHGAHKVTQGLVITPNYQHDSTMHNVLILHHTSWCMKLKQQVIIPHWTLPYRQGPSQIFSADRNYQTAPVQNDSTAENSICTVSNSNFRVFFAQNVLPEVHDREVKSSVPQHVLFQKYWWHLVWESQYKIRSLMTGKCKNIPIQA